jgi:deoxyribodipyrimidine photo-lyase
MPRQLKTKFKNEAEPVKDTKRNKKKKTEVEAEDQEIEATFDGKMPGTGNVLPPPQIEYLPINFSTGTVFRQRIRVLKAEGKQRNGPILYWMARDQRSVDNWALNWAIELSNICETGVCVAFNLVPSFKNAPLRHYDFMLRGLQELEGAFKKLNVPFFLTSGNPSEQIPALVNALNISAVVTDYSPLRLSRAWKEAVCEALEPGVHAFEVDAHNVVPAWLASPKQEWSAATFRKRIYGYLPELCVDNFPEPVVQDEKLSRAISEAFGTHMASLIKSKPPTETPQLRAFCSSLGPIDWTAAQAGYSWDASVPPVTWIVPGQAAAQARMKAFLDPAQFKTYKDDRNFPDKNRLSGLSPYLHYGHISAQRVAVEASKLKASCKDSFDSFFEELVVRRELSDNFCHYQPLHDTYDGVPPWSKITLEDHANDKREYLYSEQQLEAFQTHDDLWNAAQQEMVVSGKMHGYVRMYWAKKILEWTESPRRACEIAIRLNDRSNVGFCQCH